MQTKHSPITRSLVILVLLGAVVFSCSPGFAQTFTDQTSELVPTGTLSAHAVAWGDYNGDGYVDFLNSDRVYRNNGPDPITGDWSFTEAFHLGGAYGIDGVWADYDNDGRLDIYAWNRNEVLRNAGGDSFMAVTMPAMNSTQRFSASWADFDNNGYVDLYVPGGGNSNQPNAIMMNNGVSFTKSSDGGGGNNRGVTSSDFDRDGDQDIYVSAYWSGNELWRNDPSGFTSAASAHGVFYEDSPGFTGGSAWGDFDNDGNMDLFVANLNHRTGQDNSLLYGNLGSSDSYNFRVRAEWDGADYQEGYGSPALGDYDNDGDLDLFQTVWAGYGNAARLYRNDGPDPITGEWRFVRVTDEESGLSGLDGSYGAAWADLDNDGDLDLHTQSKIYVNDGNSNHWLKVHLTGDGVIVNGAAIGSTVRITVNGETMTRQVEGGTGIGNQNDLTLHFGLGSHSGPVDLEITAPNGTLRMIYGVAVDQTVAYGTSEPTPIVGRTVVEADPTNTGPGIGAPITDASDDNMWTYRDSKYIMSYNSEYGGEDCPQITQKVTVAEGLYDVYMLWWTFSVEGEASGTTIQAALTGDPLVQYTDPDGTDTGTSADSMRLRQVYLGRTGLTTSISVDIDDVPTGVRRAMYEGLAIELVPEPSMLGLMLLGGLALLRRRR